MKIELTDSEIEVVMRALHHFASAPHSARKGVSIDEINELADDIREQDCRRDDGWDTELEGRTFTVAEDDMIQRGIDAREKQKATSRAQSRRTTRMMKGTATATDGDTWPLNDPADW